MEKSCTEKVLQKLVPDNFLIKVYKYNKPKQQFMIKKFFFNNNILK